MATKKKKKENYIAGIFRGKILPIGFFSRYWAQIIAIICIFVFFISSKFKAQKEIEQIISLKKELNEARVGLIEASSDYNTRIREPNMVEYVNAEGMNLKMTDKPNYKLLVGEDEAEE